MTNRDACLHAIGLHFSDKRNITNNISPLKPAWTFDKRQDRAMLSCCAFRDALLHILVLKSVYLSYYYLISSKQSYHSPLTSDIKGHFCQENCCSWDFFPPKQFSVNTRDGFGKTQQFGKYSDQSLTTWHSKPFKSPFFPYSDAQFEVRQVIYGHMVLPCDLLIRCLDQCALVYLTKWPVSVYTLLNWCCATASTMLTGCYTVWPGMTISGFCLISKALTEAFVNREIEHYNSQTEHKWQPK